MSYLAWYQPVFTFRSLVSHFGSGTVINFSKLLLSDEHTIDAQELLRKAREKVAERAEAARKSDQVQTGMPASLKYLHSSMVNVPYLQLEDEVFNK